MNIKMDPVKLGRKLVSARKAAGVTQQIACEVLGCSRPTLIAMEKGNRATSSEELVKLCKLYGVGVHQFLRSDSPEVELAPHLRAAAGKYQESLAQAIGELQSYAEDYRYLEEICSTHQPEQNYPEQIHLHPNALSVQLAQDIASRERARLGLGDQAITNLLQVLESRVGLRVFCAPLPSDVAGMFAFVPSLGYCIMINSKHPPERQRLTMAHEYWHFLTERNRPGIDYTASARRPAGERLADAFAAAFLMPEISLRRDFIDIQSRTGDFQVADLCRLSDVYFVSLHALALRMEKLGLLPNGTWDEIKELGLSVRQAKAELDLAPRQSEFIHPFPEKYLYLAVRAFSVGKLSEGELSRILRADRVAARRMVGQCFSRLGVGAIADTAPARLNFGRSLLKQVDGELPE